jgi:hypothetical protein
MNNPTTRPIIERRLADIHAAAGNASPDAALAALTALHADVGLFVEASKAKLLETSLAWSDDQKADAHWIHETNQRVAALCLRITDALRRQVGADDTRTLQGIAFSLLYMGEAMKWEIASGARAPRDYRALHGLVSHAIAAGRQQSPLRLDVGGRARGCTLESLYFRALLLARFASGNLSCAQIEILDEWLWIWAPILQGVPVPPAGPALRADLDSSLGLRQGPRRGEGPVLYLPQGPVEAAFASLVAQFHAGRIVPSTGCTATLRIEEHVAVLDLIRRGLRASKRESIPRAVRRSASFAVEVYIGLTEIEQRGFLPPPPHATMIALAAADGIALGTARGERERDAAIGDIYDPLRRLVNLVDVSDSGLGFEGSDAACEPMAVGALVGLRLTPHGPLLIGKVARRMPTGKVGRSVVGVRRISSDARVISATCGAGAAANRVSMVYVRGDDRSGCEDAYLVGERTFDQGGTFEVGARENTFSFRFNRVRERGRGWVLAGFEILTARPTVEAAAR